MSKQQIILRKLERQLLKVIALLAKTEPQADLAFCEKEAKTLTVIIKALATLRSIKNEVDDEQIKQGGQEVIYETDKEFRSKITQKLASINKKAD